ncbi:MAG: DUF4124 domain-containing protein [Mariprofundaceae bacterium]
MDIRLTSTLAGVLILFGLPGAVSAGQIFQWRDASGVVHFSDNPSTVPPQYRQESQRDVKPLTSMAESDSGSVVSAPAGKAVWAEKCAACHYIGKEPQAGKVNLAHLLVNPVTRFPEDSKEVLRQLRFGANGRYSDMDEVEISETELKQVTKYLLSIGNK